MKSPLTPFLFLLPLVLAAQEGAPAPTNAAPDAPQAASPPSGPNISGVNIDSLGGDSRAAGEVADRLFDADTDWIDFENGTFKWKGRTFNLGNSRAVRARFERYLAMPPLDENEAAYLDLLAQIKDKLSQVEIVDGVMEVKTGVDIDEHIHEAWKLLFEAGNFELDGGVCIDIADKVYNSWRVREENEQLNRARATLEQEKQRRAKDVQAHQWNLDAELSRMTNAGRSSLEHRSQVAEEQDRLTTNSRYATNLADAVALHAETISRIEAMEARRVTAGVQAKLEFQSQALALLLSRRYDHTLIATGFYRYVFRGSHQELEVGQKQLQEFMPISDFKPTIDALAGFAREALRDVRDGMRTVEMLYERNELLTALERLQETFILGEFTIVVGQFPYEKKQSLLDFYRKSRELEDLLDAKDYKAVDELVAELDASTGDFPASTVSAHSRSAQQLSNISVMAARAAMSQQQDMEMVSQKLREATLLWPLNPAIASFSDDLARNADRSSKGSELFRELLEDGSYRAIYNRRIELGAALSGDEANRAKLQEIVKRLSTIDTFILQAEGLAEQGHHYNAWELLEEARNEDADDPVLAKAVADLVPKVADFSRAIQRAREAEAEGRFPISLNHFLQAQRLHPTSTNAHEGLQRVAKKLMESLPSQGATTEAATESSDDRDPFADGIVSGT